MKKRRFLSVAIYLLLLWLIFSWGTGIFGSSGNAIPYSAVEELFQHEQVRSFTVAGSRLTMDLRSPYNGDTTVSTELADPEGFRADMQELFRASASPVFWKAMTL